MTVHFEESSEWAVRCHPNQIAEALAFEVPLAAAAAAAVEAATAVAATAVAATAVAATAVVVVVAAVVVAAAAAAVEQDPFPPKTFAE